jgi:ribosomal protein L21
MYAVVETGGKQVKVEPGKTIVVEKLPGEAGSEIRLQQVLMLVDAEGATHVGQPYVSGAAAVGRVVAQERRDPRLAAGATGLRSRSTSAVRTRHSPATFSAGSLPVRR